MIRNGHGLNVMNWRDTVLEKTLVGKGFHPAGKWWTATLGKIFSHRPRLVVVRAGRRAGKSVHSSRGALHDTITRDWRIDPGDIGIIAIVSARRWQAEDRVKTLRKYVEALGYEIVKPDNNARFDFVIPGKGTFSVRALSATGGDVVSGTFVAVICDEVARWIDDRGFNPATEVIASIKPSLASTGGIMWLISSPMGTQDAHAKEFNQGDSEHRLVFHAETWVANSELFTEEDCRALEPDDLIFRREYAAQPLAADGGLWLNSALLDVAIGAPFGESIDTVTGGDLAFMRDAAAISVVSSDEYSRMRLTACSEWRPIDNPLVPNDVIDEAIAIAKGRRSRAVTSDQWARAHLMQASRNAGIPYVKRPDNGAHWEFARRALNSGRVVLPLCHETCNVCGGDGTCIRLIDQLRRVRVVPEGNRLRYEHARTDGAHGDLAESWAAGIYLLRNSLANVNDETYGLPSRFGAFTSGVSNLRR